MRVDLAALPPPFSSCVNVPRPWHWRHVPTAMPTSAPCLLQRRRPHCPKSRTAWAGRQTRSARHRSRPPRVPTLAASLPAPLCSRRGTPRARAADDRARSTGLPAQCATEARVGHSQGWPRRPRARTSSPTASTTLTAVPLDATSAACTVVPVCSIWVAGVTQANKEHHDGSAACLRAGTRTALRAKHRARVRPRRRTRARLGWRCDGPDGRQTPTAAGRS